MKYKINTKSQFSNGFPIILFALGTVVIYYLLILKNGDVDHIELIRYCVVFFLFQLVPLLILHLNYYRVNKHTIVEFNEQEKIITVTDNLQKINFNASDIKAILLDTSFPRKNDKMPFLAWDRYCHCYVTLNNSKRIVITSLLIPGLPDFLKNLSPAKIINEGSFFRSVSGNSIQ